MRGLEEVSPNDQQRIFERKQEIRVGERTFPFNIDDKIFTMDKIPSSKPQKNPNSDCHVCAKHLDKHAVDC